MARATPNTSADAPPSSTADAPAPSHLEAEEAQLRAQREKADAARSAQLAAERQKDVAGGAEVVDSKFKALEYLLSQSKLYSTIMLAQMQRQEEEEERQGERARKREEKAEGKAVGEMRRATRRGGKAEETEQEQEQGVKEEEGGEVKLAERPRRGRPPAKGAGKKEGPKKISDFFKKEAVQEKAGTDVKAALEEAVKEEEEEKDKAAKDGVKTADIGIQNLRSARQPKLVTGGTMRSYQLEGLEWLTSLYENGLNGILADEMGLGKTVQTISFLAFLREKGSYGPFLVAAPLSTTTNWVEEFRKWTPSIPVVLYHGSKQEREQIRKKQLKRPGTAEFPVVVTSYEICMNDRKFLANFGWKFIIIDEGHRIKNLNCRLIRELQSYQSSNRLLITGTPLQNNLTELWSLLHFLMPTIFDKLEAFESWFDFSALKDSNGYEQVLSEERQQKLVASLHAILKPFLLRRVKADVEDMMPRKREYVLYAPLTPMQRDLYQAILDGTSRQFLEEQAEERFGSGAGTPRSARSTSSVKRKAAELDGAGTGTTTPSKSAKTSREGTPASTRSRRGRPRKNYEEISDAQWFKKVADEEAASRARTPEADSPASAADEEEAIRAENLVMAKRQIAAKKLQNPIMQLRLCCDSPYNFFNPFLVTTSTNEDDAITPDETLVTTSGKMLLLDGLLPELLRRGHKVLIFSQFKTQLDLLELYATQLRGWRCCRIDGGVPQAERQAQIHAFNRSNDDEDRCDIFLLSTRAGGQGINLAAADTVVLFDSDWNPQQDLQAQDRAHRIGQTRPVLVYRLATRNTVEQRLLDGAHAKRRLEKLVIRKGGLSRAEAQQRNQLQRVQREEMEELQRLLRREDGLRWDVDGAMLSEGDLEVLLDRSEEAFERAEKGLDDGGTLFRAVENRGEGALMEGLKA